MDGKVWLGGGVANEEAGETPGCLDGKGKEMARALKGVNTLN